MNKFLKKFFIFVLLFCLFFGLEPEVLAAKLKFVQVSDVHFSTVREDTSYKLLARSRELLEDAVKQINEMKNVDFVMFTGDLIDQPNVESFEEVMPYVNKLNAPWYFTLGNHDTTDNGEMTKSKIISLLLANNPNLNINSLYYSFTPKKGFKVIVLDSVIDEKSVSTGVLTQDQLKFVDFTLKKSKKDVVLIFMHHPLFQPFRVDNHKLTNDKEFYALLEKYNMPIAVFSGHYHMTKIIRHGNILSVSTPALITYPNAFRAVIISNNRKEAVFNFLFYETGLKELQKKTKFIAYQKDRLTGKPNDRTCTIVIDKKRK